MNAHSQTHAQTRTLRKHVTKYGKVPSSARPPHHVQLKHSHNYFIEVNIMVTDLQQYR